ncbi:hypothetical protein S40288_04986 [Stachybotrys chartarum IBT 40288]|nr:hypothetical protein S40288_04986 [Stachybotrys chartarum IBT 40288]
MMRFSRSMLFAAAAAQAVFAKPAFMMYFDQWHTTTLPDRSVTAGVNYVITAFAQSDIFNSGTWYQPFKPVTEVRALFDDGVKVCMAIGGWGDTSGFGVGAATEASRATFARNVAQTLDNLGYDCVDVDWEYPGGNGEDYKQKPNDQKVQEIETYPLLLQAIKAAIGDKELSIAVPGRLEDMIAFTPEKVPLINETVDHVNVMTYDLMNRRMSTTEHHTSIKGSLSSIDTYIQRGMSPSKLILGFAFYAKWFTTQPGVQCTTPTGCATAVLEGADGSDTGLSGAVTFEVANYNTDPAFADAMQKGRTDVEAGGVWYWDAGKGVYWTWDSAELIARKFSEVVAPRGLGGVMAWSLAQDSHDWSHLKAMQAGVAGMQ